jgi:hypothetical protein
MSNAKLMLILKGVVTFVIYYLASKNILLPFFFTGAIIFLYLININKNAVASAAIGFFIFLYVNYNEVSSNIITIKSNLLFLIIFCFVVAVIFFGISTGVDYILRKKS